MNYTTIDLSKATKQFIEVMQSHGLNPSMHIEPERFYRFPGIDKDHKNKAGWCRLFESGLGGVFGDFSSGICEIWQVKREQPFSPNEKLKFKRDVEESHIKRNLERKQIQLNAQKEANSIWLNAKELVTYAYLIKKQVNSHGLKLYIGDKVISGMPCNNTIMIPLYYDNEIVSLQFIADSGDKRFLFGGRKDGCYFKIGNPQESDIVCIAEGYATAATIYEDTSYPVIVAFDSGNLLKVTERVKAQYSNKTIIICADDDFLNSNNPGLTKAKEAALKFGTKLAIPSFGDNRPKNATDFNDMLQLSGAKAVREIINAALEVVNYPLPLPSITQKVKKLDPELMLPVCIRDYIIDIAERQQCPPDFVAITTLVGLSSLLGRKALIRPKAHDDWTVTPNQWGVIVGRPSAMKSPSMKEALKPLKKIETDNADLYEEQLKQFNIDQELLDLSKSNLKDQIKKLLKGGDKLTARELLEHNNNDECPIRHRLIVNDATVEKLGELLNENSNGLILIRDELSGWLARLMREDGQQDRAFYLECFDGDGHFTYDRIGRGTIEIDNCTLSVIGGIQPSKILNLLYQAVNGIADDGLIQRLQLTTWPDDTGLWQWIDRTPNKVARDKYYDTFKELHELTFSFASDEPKIFHFTPEAQQLFIHWMEELHSSLKTDDISPLLESHLLKMPQTIAGLALLFEIIDGGRGDSVGVAAIAYAIEWAYYLRSHAERLYNMISNLGLDGAKLILDRKNKLPNPFTIRDIDRKCWSGLTDSKVIADAIAYLVDYHHILPTEIIPSIRGGRPTIAYAWNTNIPPKKDK